MKINLDFFKERLNLTSLKGKQSFVVFLVIILIEMFAFHLSLSNILDNNRYFLSDITGSLSSSASHRNCRLKCGDFCYNQDYLKCLNGTAQVSEYGSIAQSVIMSEDNQPKSYSSGSNAIRTYSIHNNLGRSANISVTAYFYPIAYISYGSSDMYVKQTKILNNKIFSLSTGETKQIDVTIPTQEVTLSANIKFTISDADNNVGISWPYYSAPFSIYDNSSSIEKENCHGYIINSTGYPYLCTSDYFIPLGSIGCYSNSQCVGRQQCIDNSCNPSLSKDRPANRVKLLIVTGYLQTNSVDIVNLERTLSGEVGNLIQKFNSISSDLGVSNTIYVDQKKCSVSRSILLNWLNNVNASDSITTKANSLLRLCGIDGANYTHIDLNFPNKNLSDADAGLITQKIYNGSFSTALYFGNGYFVSDIKYSGQWPIILHEMTHSFGAPDIYTENNVNGQTYLWGDCLLMSGQTTFNMSTKLCLLEASYYKTVQPSITVTSPNGGENWVVGMKQIITWTPSSSGTVRIEIIKGTSSSAVVSLDNIPDRGSYTWVVPAGFALGNDYRVRITKSYGEIPYDASDKPFSVVARQRL